MRMDISQVFVFSRTAIPAAIAVRMRQQPIRMALPTPHVPLVSNTGGGGSSRGPQDDARPGELLRAYSIESDPGHVATGERDLVSAPVTPPGEDGVGSGGCEVSDGLVAHASDDGEMNDAQDPLEETRQENVVPDGPMCSAIGPDRPSFSTEMDDAPAELPQRRSFSMDDLESEKATQSASKANKNITASDGLKSSPKGALPPDTGSDRMSLGQDAGLSLSSSDLAGPARSPHTPPRIVLPDNSEPEQTTQRSTASNTNATTESASPVTPSAPSVFDSPRFSNGHMLRVRPGMQREADGEEPSTSAQAERADDERYVF